MGKLFEEFEVIPIADIVILKRHKESDMTEGGLYLSAGAIDISVKATVLAAGPGKQQAGAYIKTTVQVGDEVIADKIGGFDLEIGGEKLLIVREAEIIAVIRTKVKE